MDNPFVSASRVTPFVQLNRLVLGSVVNLQGIVVASFDAEKTTGSDWKSAVMLDDPSLDHSGGHPKGYVRDKQQAPFGAALFSFRLARQNSSMSKFKGSRSPFSCPTAQTTRSSDVWAISSADTRAKSNRFEASSQRR